MQLIISATEFECADKPIKKAKKENDTEKLNN